MERRRCCRIQVESSLFQKTMKGPRIQLGPRYKQTNSRLQLLINFLFSVLLNRCFDQSKHARESSLLHPCNLIRKRYLTLDWPSHQPHTPTTFKLIVVAFPTLIDASENDPRCKTTSNRWCCKKEKIRCLSVMSQSSQSQSFSTESSNRVIIV